MHELLLIDPDPRRAAAVRSNFSYVGWQAEYVDSVEAALTVLDWIRPDVILVRDDLEGCSAEDAGTVLQRKASVLGAAVVLLATGPLSNTDVRSFDMVIESEVPPIIVAWLEQRDVVDQRGKHDAETGETVPAEEGAEEGEYAAIEVLESFASAMVTGRLEIHTPGEASPFSVVYDHGRIIHVAQGDRKGMETFSALLRLGKEHRDPLAPSARGLWYQFENMASQDVDHCVRTIEPTSFVALCKIAGFSGLRQT